MSTKKDEPIAPGTKNLATGETEPPLPHDEYTEAFNKRASGALKEAEQRQRQAAKTAEPAPGLPGENIDPRTTGGKK